MPGLVPGIHAEPREPIPPFAARTKPFSNSRMDGPRLATFRPRSVI